MKISDLKQRALDLFEYKRLRDKVVIKELIRDMSNVKSGDTEEEQIFKIYEQVKNYNT